MKKYLLPLLLLVMLLSCSPDEKVNSNPSDFALEDVSFTGTKLNLSWTSATDPDDEPVYYSVYINSTLIEGPVQRNSLITTLEYNKDYEGLIIATDHHGGTSQINFNFRSPTSKIALVGDFQAGNLRAIDLHTQSTLWTAQTVDNNYIVSNGLVFTGLDKISAYNIISGEKAWDARPVTSNNAIGYRHLMADDQFLFAKVTGANIICIDLERQEKQWELSLFESNSLYTMDKNNLYIPKRNNADLISVNKITGEIEWGFTLDGAVSSLSPGIKHAPLIYGENLYFQDNNGRFYSVNKKTGIKNYSLLIGKTSPAAPVGLNDDIIFSARDEIISLKAGSGQINWRYNVGAVSSSSPFESNGLIYVGAGNDLFCLDANTGILKWKTNLGGEINSSPVVYDQKVYISSHDANLHCIDATSGNMEWKTAASGFSVSSPTLVIGDTEEVIYPSNSGYHE